MPAAINEAMKEYILFCLQFTVYPKQPPALPLPTFGVTQVDLELMTLQSQALGYSDNRCVPPPGLIFLEYKFCSLFENLSLVHRPSHIKCRSSSFDFKAFYPPVSTHDFQLSTPQPSATLDQGLCSHSSPQPLS